MTDDTIETKEVSITDNNSGLTDINSVFCRSCGKSIRKNAEICPNCGVRQLQHNTKSPGLAAILSFLIVGLGQVYNGQVGKGILFFILQILNFLLVYVGIGILTVPAFWIYGIYDAYKTAENINNNVITN